MRLMRGDQVIPDTVDTHTRIMFGVHVDHAHTAHVCTTMQTAAVSYFTSSTLLLAASRVLHRDSLIAGVERH